MKSLLIAILTCTLLCSCSKNHTQNEYFLHAIAFTQQDEQIKATALCEKYKEKTGDYFTVDVYGKGLDEISKQFKSKYKNLYVASLELYLFDESLSQDALYSLAEGICMGQLYPSKAMCLTFDSEEIQELLEEIKNEKDLIKLIGRAKKGKANVVKFLANYVDARPSVLYKITPQSMQDDTPMEKVTFRRKEDINEKD